MKTSFIRLTACGLVATALAACGGGGNESGPPDAVEASPTSITVKGSATACTSGEAGRVSVYGGSPPYKLKNSAPAAMTIDKSTVQNSGDDFTVTFNGTCMDNMPVTIEDSMGRLLAVPMSNKLG